MALKALIFDVDGTLADTEMAHMAAFNYAFEAAGLTWLWDLETYTELLEVSGGKERIRHYWNQRPDRGVQVSEERIDSIIPELHATKTARYEEMVACGDVAMRPGVLELIEAAKSAGLKLAIATTTTPANIEALLSHAMGDDWQETFTVVENAVTAPNKKPDPSVYLQALERLGLSAAEAIAIEDTNNGLRAAKGAGLATVITPNEFSKHHDFTGADLIVPTLSDVNLEQLAQLIA
jgi:HAD superfamily hydrolase (TIGR01509 family)